MTAPIPIVERLSDVTADVDLLLVDIWGVLHDGLSAYPQASHALVAARESGIAVVLVSNAPRPAGSVRTMLDRMGVPHEAYDAIATSGDVARTMLAECPGTPILHLGPERDLPLFDGLDLPRASVDAARLVVCTGLLDDETETPADYAAVLAEAHARGLPMLCANPDVVVERGKRLIYCAGALGKAYAERGGAVEYTGKPHRVIYDHAMSLATALPGSRERLQPARVLAVGDSLETDIAGANRAGFRSLFVASGIHRADILVPDGSIDVGRMIALVARHGARPDAAIRLLG